jgi:hypothetical protein
MSTIEQHGYDRAHDGRLVPPPIFTDPALDRAFWTDGFVKQPMLDSAQMEELREGFARLAPFDGFDPTTLENPRCGYHCTFLDDDHTYRRESDELVRRLFTEPIKAALPGYKILSSNIYVKPPGAGRFEIHQNWPTIADLDVPTLTVWLPLQDTGFRNGTIRVVPGSHHIFPDVAAASSDRFFDDFDAALIETYLEPVDVAAGEALMFDDSLLHWSSDNLSDSPRITFQIETIPNDAEGVLWIRNPDDPSEFELWEMDKEFWIEQDFQAVLGRPEGLPFVGRRSNPNRRISLAEFDATMRRAQEIRASKYVLD